MRILITTDSYMPMITGVVTSIVNLKRELKARGHEVRVLTLSKDAFSHYEDEVYYIGSVNAEKIYPEARFALPQRKRVIKEIVQWKPEIIHSQSEFSSFVWAQKIARKLDIPIVHSYHTLYEDFTHYIHLNKKIGTKIAKSASNKIINWVEHVIVPTVKIKNKLREYGVYRDISVIPTGMNLNKFDFSMSLEEKETLKLKLGIPKDHKVVLFLGRLGKEKNIDEILLYMSMCNLPKVSLLIAGDGPYREDLVNFTVHLHMDDRVFFAGKIRPEDVSIYYQTADLFVSASTSETQGLTYIEALASGTPILCKQDPCLDDIVIDGINGWQYSSFAEFEKKLSEVLSNQDIMAKLKNHTRESVRKKYSADVFAKEVEAVYKNILEKKGILNRNLLSYRDWYYSDESRSIE